MPASPSPDRASRELSPAQSPAPAGRAAPRLVVVLIAVAIVLTLGAVGTGFFLASRVTNDAAAPQTGPIAVPAAPAPGASGRYCSALMPKLPSSLNGEPRRKLLVADPGVAVWGDPAIILRCGLPDPAELTCSANLTRFTNADGRAMDWLQIAEGGSVTYLAADRPVRIAVTLPEGADIAAIQDLSDVITGSLPARPLCNAGGIVPADNS